MITATQFFDKLSPKTENQDYFPPPPAMKIMIKDSNTNESHEVKNIIVMSDNLVYLIV